MVIRIEGIENLKKVSMSKAINRNSPLNLKQSKAFTDFLLTNKYVEIEVEHEWNIETLINDLKDANANIV